MKNRLMRVLIFCAFACCGQQGTSVGVIHELPKEAVEKTVSLNPKYCVFGEAAVAAGKKVPLLIYLHGAGGVGSDIGKAQRQAKGLMPVLERAKINAIVVAPQASKNPRKEGAKGGWVAGDLNILLAHLLKSLPVNPDRVYLTGNSMGGYGTFMWAGYHPEHFAAIGPMVGGLGPLGPKDVTKDLDLWGKNIATLPMRAYYGGKDRVVPADRGAMILKAIKKNGGTQAEVIVLADQGHNAGRIPLGDVAFIHWLFSHTRVATLATRGR